MVAAGTLMVFAVVALALIWHRYTDARDRSVRGNPRAAAGLGTLTAAGIGESRK